MAVRCIALFCDCYGGMDFFPGICKPLIRGKRFKTFLGRTIRERYLLKILLNSTCTLLCLYI